MSLFEIRNVVFQKKLMSLNDLSLYFNCDEDLLRHKMSHWVKNGCIRCLEKTPNCGSCAACPKANVEIYEWVGGQNLE